MAGQTSVLPPEGRARSRSDGPTSLKSRDDVVEEGQDQTQSKSDSGAAQNYSGQRYHGSKAWWSVGEFLHQGITHQSVGLSLGRNEEETWDLSDSLADLYQAVTQRQRDSPERLGIKNHSRSDSGGTAVGRSKTDMLQDIRRWLDEDTSNGYIRVYASDLDSHSRLFPCTLSTSAQKICLQMGIPGNSLHVQLSGDVIRRMEPFDCPLAIQNEYLAGLGYASIRYIQEEGPSEDLAYLVRFYAGKPLSDFTYSRNQLSTYAYIRKGKLLHQWTRRLCVISGTRLLIYREKGTEPTAVQLARGSVEEVLVKGQSNVLKLTSTLQGERSLYMSFSTPEDYNKWLRKIRKATAKLPGKADLSNCHLEFLPETVFVNTELEILILRHNALRERPIEEDIYTIGWLDDLPRFNCLRSLNLADNQLTSFPLSLTNIRSLVELNLASNKLEEIPAQIAELANLQVLHLHNNMLSSLPEELGQMRNLAVVVLAFNRFAHVPVFLLQSQLINCKVDSVIMAGNQISRLPPEHLSHMAHIKKIDLRLNRLQLLPTETAKFHSLEHVTHMDIRENQVPDLDVRAIRQLEYLNCERNNMRSMQLNGSSLKNVFASHNYLQTLSINPKPEWLVTLDVSNNKLTDLPQWLPDCFFLVSLDVSHNSLRALPDRLLTDGRRLKSIKANHNRLTALPEKISTDTLEELHLQHNMIRHLSSELFLKATRLRYLNVTKNKLCDLPPPNTNDSYNKLQELYLSFNHLANRALEKICCFPRLRVLHMARNKLSVINETDIEKLEQLSELNFSANNLTYLPAALGRHPKLQVLRANCNLLQELPNFKNSSGLKVLEVSSNHLVNVDMSNLMASQVSLLDISANPSILVKSHDIEAAKKRLCMLDMRGQNWSLEDVRGPDKEGDDKGLRWQTGLSQTSGIRNKLSVTTINKPVLGDSGGEALFAVFDGGRNETVASLLCDVVPTTLREERAKSKDPSFYLKYCLLSAHRNLKTKGQKLGASAAVVHIHRDERGQDVLSVANVGDSQAVLCRQRRAFLMSRAFVVTKDSEDTRRVVNAGGIITEDGRVSGVTYNTRLMGCSYLFPHVIPDPHVSSTTLTPDDTAVIVANQGLWQFVSYEEAIREIKDIPDPVVAAKRLQDLAQGYGSRENIAILVVRLMLSQEERLRIHDLMRVQRKAQKELLKVLNPRDNLLLLRDGVPRVEELNEVTIDKYGHAKKGRRGSRKALHNEDGSSSLGSSVVDGLTSSQTAVQGQQYGGSNSSPVDSERNESDFDNYERSQRQRRKKRSSLPDEAEGSGSPKLSHYRKKSSSSSQTSTESVKRRIQEEIKTREIRNIFNEGAENAPHLPNSRFKENESLDSQNMSNEEPQANWLAQKPKEGKKGSNPEEWQDLLHRRLTQELVDREIKKMVKEKRSAFDEESEDGSMSDEASTNWATQERVSRKTSDGFSSDGILSRPITRPGADGGEFPSGVNSTAAPYDAAGVKAFSNSNSLDSLSSETMHMFNDSPDSISLGDISKLQDNRGEQYGINSIQNSNDFDEDFEEDRFSVSPSESVSSIDLRLHNEADEIYRLRYFNPHQSQNDLPPANGSIGGYPPPPPFQDSGEHTANHQGSVVDRPMSPDSLISQDDFVKPPINTTNIDRDALLFHQMQMARAQAHAGSVASLDSVQSAPMHTDSRRDIFPQVRTSSHSIEVLVNIGEGEEEKRQDYRSGSSRELGRASSQIVDRRWGSSDPSQSGSSSTITGGSSTNIGPKNRKSHESFDSSQKSSNPSKEKLNYRQPLKDTEGTAHGVEAFRVTSKSNFNNEDEGEDDDDRSTLIGANEADDIANLEDLDVPETHQEKEIAIENGLRHSTVQETSTVFSGVNNSPCHIPHNVTSTDQCEANDSDSDESIGNVSLGDGYTAIEFPTNIDRNGSLSMLNVLESESEDYPDFFSNSKSYDHRSNKDIRKSLQSHLNKKQKTRHEINNSVHVRSKQNNIEILQVHKESPKDRNDNVSTTNLEHDRHHAELHGNSDYEDIDELKEEHPDVKSEPKPSETFVDDMNLYEEMQYSPTATVPKQIVQVEPPPPDKPTEEDIDALYAKVNKIKMQKLHSETSSKANTNMDGLLLLDHTSAKVSNALRQSSENKNIVSPPPSLPERFTPEGMETPKDDGEEIFISAPNLPPKVPLRPPLPSKPANGFSNGTRVSPSEIINNRVQLHNMQPKESSSHKQVSQSYPSSRTSQETTSFHNSKAYPVVPNKNNLDVQNSFNFEDASISQHSGAIIASRADPSQKTRTESTSAFHPHNSEKQRERKAPPPLPPKKPFLNQKVKDAPPLPPSRPPFPLKPQLQRLQQQQQHRHQNQDQYHQQQQQNRHQNQQQPKKTISPQNSMAYAPPLHPVDNHEDFNFYSEKNRKHQKPIAPPAPKPRVSKKSSHPPSVPMSSKPFSTQMSSTKSTQPIRLTEPLPFKSQPRPDKTVLPPGGTFITFPHVDDDNGDDDVDNSVLSAHELYPDAHFPGSSYLPNSSEYPAGTYHLPSRTDMTVAASKLPTQRSIIITYL